MKRRLVAAVMVFVGLGSGPALMALSTSTHALVNQAAGRHSATLEDRLRRGLGFPDGRTTLLRADGERLTVEEWLGRGGIREDDLLRFLRHFHDPLKPWATAGLDLGIDRHDSSVRWMQHASQGGLSTGGFWSWGDARRLYYEALTEPNPAAREALWAGLFRALGQVMHLVADASVPEHTRNDIHAFSALKLANSYERWVASQHGVGASESGEQFAARYLSTPIWFPSPILTLAVPDEEPVARVPVARLIDTDRYDGTNPSVTVDGGDPRAPVSVGLAEIANANFFSEDTLRGRYPFPTDEGLIPVNLATPFGRVRRYLSRPSGLGLLPANPLRAECAADDYYQHGDMAQPPPYPCTDALVWGQVAAHMLPRAVGYATGVLEYFFRGGLQVNSVYWQGGSSPGIHISVTNTSDEALDGVLTMHARHGSWAAERREWSGSLASGERVQLGPGATATLPLSLREGTGTSGAHVLVFRGRLGLEDDAVIGQVFTVPYVLVRQDRHETDLRRECLDTVATPRTPLPSPQYGLQVLRSHHAQCFYVPVNQRMSGVIHTNSSLESSSETLPAIAAIDAYWQQGLNRFAAPLALDGETAPGGMWRRLGAEPDPSAFEVFDPTPHVVRAELILAVRLMSGETIRTGLTGFGEASVGHVKQLRAHYDGSTWAYLLQADRGVNITVISNHADPTRPRFVVDSIAGVPYPTDTMHTRVFRGFSVGAEGVRVSQLGQADNRSAYTEGVSDDFREYGHGALSQAVGDYEAIGPMLAPHPSGPHPRWEAVIKRLHDPIELAFLRAFVDEEVDAQTIALTAREEAP